MGLYPKRWAVAAVALLLGFSLPMILAKGRASAAPLFQEAPTVALPMPSVYASAWFPKEEEARADYRDARDRRLLYIHQNLQTMFVFEDGAVVHTIPCSTGLHTPRTRTRAWIGRVGEYWGTFQAYGVWADEAWFLFKDDGSILIHGAPYTLENGDKVYQDLDLLGVRPGSHGCIRISPEDAKWLTAWEPQGVLVVITPLTVVHGDG